MLHMADTEHKASHQHTIPLQEVHIWKTRGKFPVIGDDDECEATVREVTHRESNVYDESRG